MTNLALLPAFLALFARGTAFAFVAPVIGERNVAARWRVAAVAVLAMSCAPLHAPLGLHELAPAVLLEVAIGLLAGFCARLVVSAAEIAGELVGLGAGLGFASAFDPAAGGMAMPTRRLFAVVVGLCFVGAGGFEVLVRILAIPLVEPMVLVRGIPTVFARAAEAMSLGVHFAGPILVATTVINVAMGLASRAAPALNVFSVTLAASIVATLGVLVATGPRIATDLFGLGERAVSVAMEVAAP